MCRDRGGFGAKTQIYAMFLLWMLSELFDTLPEAGDLEKPKFVFFFDEAHLLFNDMPGELLDKIVQVVKLIRSKGVGVYLITQSPSDIPDEVLAQLSNRVQHGLRAYTPAEQKAVRADAQTDLMAKYGKAVDRESAFEQLSEEAEKDAEAERLAEERAALEKERAELEKLKAKEAAKAEREAEKAAEREARAAEKQQEQLMKGIGKIAGQIFGTFGREATRQITRNLFGGRRR